MAGLNLVLYPAVVVVVVGGISNKIRLICDYYAIMLLYVIFYMIIN